VGSGMTVVFQKRDPLGRCPAPACVFRWRDGIDRPCFEHAAYHQTAPDRRDSATRRSGAPNPKETP
jgi:hypothetical protein